MAPISWKNVSSNWLRQEKASGISVKRINNTIIRLELHGERRKTDRERFKRSQTTEWEWAQVVQQDL